MEKLIIDDLNNIKVMGTAAVVTDTEGKEHMVSSIIPAFANGQVSIVGRDGDKISYEDILYYLIDNTDVSAIEAQTLAGYLTQEQAPIDLKETDDSIEAESKIQQVEADDTNTSIVATSVNVPAPEDQPESEESTNPTIVIQPEPLMIVNVKVVEKVQDEDTVKANDSTDTERYKKVDTDNEVVYYEPEEEQQNIDTKLVEPSVNVDVDIQAMLANDYDTGVKGDEKTKLSTFTIEGIAHPSALITLEFDGESYSTTSNSKGSWSVEVQGASDKSYKYEVSDGLSTKKFYMTVDQSVALESKVYNLVTLSDNEHVNDSFLLMGSTDPYAQLKYSLNGVDYEGNADARGHFSFNVDATRLVEGSYQLTLLTTDDAGNEKEQHVTFHYDTSISLEGKLSDKSDSGDKGDHITNIINPEFSGTTDPFSKVIITVAGNNYETTADANGHWALEVVLGTNQSLEYTISATDQAGNRTNSTGMITHDDIVLLTTFLSPDSDTGIKDDNITSIALPKFVGTTDPFAIVTLVINGKSYEAVADSDGHFEIQLNTPLADGEHTYVFQATDNVGNVIRKTDTLTIDTESPKAILVALAEESDSGKMGDGITNDNTPYIVGNTSPNSTVEMTIDGVLYRVTSDANGDFVVMITSPLSDGVYSYDVKVTTPSGVEGTVSTSFKIDTVSDSVFDLSPLSDTGSRADGKTNDTTPVFSGTAEAFSKITLTFAGKEYTAKADENGFWVIDPGVTVGNNQYTYTVVAEDVAGNTTTAQKTIDVLKQDISKLTFDGYPESGNQTDRITNINAPLLTGETDPNVTVTISIAGESYEVDADNNGHWSYQMLDVLQDGTYSYTISAEDSYGNNKQVNETITIDTVNVLTHLVQTDNGGKIDSAGGGGVVVSDTTPIISGYAELGSTVTIFLDGYSPINANVDSNGNFSVLLPTLVDGNTYEYRVVSEDIAGNITTNKGSLKIDVSVDTTTLGDEVSLGHPKLTGHTEANAAVSITIGGTTYSTIYADASGSYSLDLPSNTSPGALNVDVSVMDSVGNTSNNHFVIDIDKIDVPIANGGSVEVFS
ncbi:Ig-like domain-containing protein [Vibrio barjaei]|uniref:Ig-like domain-containing protein n=1 Tax=Vibrio barjaei TaxID=1676683 RepID=UPI0022841623|nr:Ig-like domain-containing protein [Vibrio barjaei]MCY9874830.1 Ig-like domain-containing protein [Vibrio barjaei]